MDDQKTRSAIVTGSSRGIGCAIATKLAQDGMNICLNYSSDTSKSTCETLAQSLQDTYSITACAIKADVSQFDQAQQLIDQAKETFETIDVLVNNAGITRDGLIRRMKEEDFDAVVAINLKGVFNCCKAVAGPMMKQRQGRIINISSVVGIAGNIGQVNYAASKAGVIGLSKTLAKELAPRSVTVNVIAPGFIETEMTDALTEDQQANIFDRIALRRFGKASEVAALASFLASENSSYITGQVISVDGGISL